MENEGLVVEADPTQLLVALRALCQNAIEAIGARGRVTIASGRTPAGVEIRVSDDGPGISSAERRHIFDPFYSARQAGRGLGLGLSKCWRIVASHGGRIAVESRPGEGATFIITLPEHGGAFFARADCQGATRAVPLSLRERDGVRGVRRKAEF